MDNQVPKQHFYASVDGRVEEVSEQSDTLFSDRPTLLLKVRGSKSAIFEVPYPGKREEVTVGSNIKYLLCGRLKSSRSGRSYEISSDLRVDGVSNQRYTGLPADQYGNVTSRFP